MPLRTYREVGKLVDDVRILKRHNLQDLPALILLSHRDELVSHSRTVSWLADNDLRQWSISDFEPHFAAASPYRHLIADKVSLTTEDWILAVEQVVGFLNSHRSDTPGARR